MQRCPYCRTDQSEMFAIMVNDAPKAETLVGLCTKCGELIIPSGQRFRKPTPDEHVEIHSQDKVRIARAAWLMSEALKEEGGLLPMRMGWGKFFEHSIAAKRIGRQSFESNHQLWDAFRDCFFAGAAHMLHAVHQGYDDADTYEEFEGRMLLLDTEMHAYGQARTASRDK